MHLFNAISHMRRTMHTQPLTTLGVTILQRRLLVNRTLDGVLSIVARFATLISSRVMGVYDFNFGMSPLE